MEIHFAHSSALQLGLQMKYSALKRRAAHFPGPKLEGCAPHPLLMPYSLMPSYSDTQKPLMKNICFPTFLTLVEVMDL